MNEGKKMSDDNGWGEYKREVMAELYSLRAQMASVQTDITLIKVELGKQQVKAGFVGILGGAVTSVGTIALALLILWIKNGI